MCVGHESLCKLFFKRVPKPKSGEETPEKHKMKRMMNQNGLRRNSALEGEDVDHGGSGQGA